MMTDKSKSPFAAGPLSDNKYQVGDPVEVFCDHTQGKDRVRDWLRGVVVQADEKMVAVQFKEEVYLTDGWMVPDHVLWCQQNSEQIRSAARRKKRNE